MPTEKAKTYHPPYVIEPPDVLYLDAVRLVPRPPYRIEPLDVLILQVGGTLPDQPITGQFQVSPDGTINLPYNFGTVRVVGLTLEGAALAIRNRLMGELTKPTVSVGLGSFRGVQQTQGSHLVNQDGTITLGTYGSVCVAGLTLCQAKAAIERHLSKYLLNPEISVTVQAFNSKYIYVIADGAGYGQQVYRFPITGNETVLDAISYIGGIPPQGSLKKIWVARPVPAHAGCYQILPVAWQVLVAAGDTDTNYQLFPGDRIYIHSDFLICLNNWVTKVISPIEQVLGVTLLGAATVNIISSIGRNGGTNGGGFFIP
jgi:protein involved in polysaccharide export with SLBB domain